jgi:regulator of replication initiation timing
MSDHLDQFLYDAPDTEIRAEMARLQDDNDRLSMENVELREVIGELEAEVRSLRPSPGDVR